METFIAIVAAFVAGMLVHRYHRQLGVLIKGLIKKSDTPAPKPATPKVDQPKT